MKVDRSLIGVIGIAVVLSTLFSMFLVIEQAEEGVTVLSNEYPDTPGQERRFPYALSMMSRKPLEEVKVSYTTLGEVGVINATTEPTDEETIMVNLPRIEALIEEARNLDLVEGIETWEGRVRWTNRTAGRTHELDMYMYEFTDMMKYMAPEMAVTSTFVVWINQTNRSIFRYFEGGPYHFDKSRAVEDLAVTLNDQSTRYGIIDEGEAWVEDGYEPISRAPRYGTIKFEGVEKDDRLSIDFTLKSPGGMILIRVYVNGRLETFMSASDAIEIMQ